MLGYNPKKFAIISAALDKSPNLSNRAIARLTNTGPNTVGKVRAIKGLAPGIRVEASGRRARGRMPTLHYFEERLPDDSATVYRVYNHTELLYVGVSLGFLQRLATHSKRPWWHEVTHITTIHFSERAQAEIAERDAIRTEQPKYNIVSGKVGIARAMVAARTRAHITIDDYRAAAAAVAALPATPAPGRIRRPTGRVLV